jgi:hypothetical protein
MFTMDEASLRQVCESFDGRHTDDLERTLRQCSDRRALLDCTLAIARRGGADRFMVAATWLILNASRRDAEFVDRHAKRWVTMLAAADHWEVRLHLLQLLDGVDMALSLGAPERTALFKAATRSASDDNRLVRAWSLSVLGRLGGHLRSAQGRIAALIAHAEEQEAASVKARIRRLRRDGSLRWLAD